MTRTTHHDGWDPGRTTAGLPGCGRGLPLTGRCGPTRSRARVRPRPGGRRRPPGSPRGALYHLWDSRERTETTCWDHARGRTAGRDARWCGCDPGAGQATDDLPTPVPRWADFVFDRFRDDPTFFARIGMLSYLHDRTVNPDLDEVPGETWPEFRSMVATSVRRLGRRPRPGTDLRDFQRRGRRTDARVLPRAPQRPGPDRTSWSTVDPRACCVMRHRVRPRLHPNPIRRPTTSSPPQIAQASSDGPADRSNVDWTTSASARIWSPASGYTNSPEECAQALANVKVSDVARHARVTKGALRLWDSRTIGDLTPAPARRRGAWRGLGRPSRSSPTPSTTRAGRSPA